MAKLKQKLTPWVLAAVVVLTTGAAFGLARAVWDFNGFPARQAAMSASCQNNLKQMGLSFKMFANEQRGGQFPILGSVSGNIMFKSDELHPYFLSNTEVMICPGPKGEVPTDVFTDQFYVYPGYVIRNDQDLDAFVAGYTAEIANGADFSENLPVETSYGSELLRLREGIERFLITDINNAGASAQAQATIPVMWEWPDNHQQGFGGNVLYMDGHVEWHDYPGEFPMTEHAVATMASLAGYTPPTDWHGRVVETAYIGRGTFIASCQNNMKRVGLVNKMYANESQGAKFPPLSSTGGKLMMESAGVHPEYTEYNEGPGIFICPGREVPEPAPFFDDEHYVYLGYLLKDDSDVQQFATAYQGVIGSGGDFDDDLPVASSYGTSIYRIREGVERFLITDINNPLPPPLPQHEIVVMFEWPENHEWNSGGNVLYMDGHVEWQPYPGEFPMTEATISTLRALAQTTPATTWGTEDAGPQDRYGYINPCSSRLKQWGLINQMFSNESFGEVFPRLSATHGELTPRETEVYPEYLVDLEVGRCPGVAVEEPATGVTDEHYAYLGYALANEADVLAFAGAYTASGAVPEGDIDVPSSYGAKILRLKEGVHRSILRTPGDPNSYVPESEIPVMIEWPGNHETLAGGHVLYMDGHVEWHDYPGEFPMTENVINALDGIAHWTAATAWSVPRFADSPDQYNNGICKGNVNYFGLSCKIYAGLAEGDFFPPLSPEPALLMMEDDRFNRFQLGDIRRMNCPGSTMAYRQPEIHDDCYAYLGYVIPDQETLERFATGYQQQIAAGGDFTGNLLEGEDTVYRMREGVERFLITDINSPAQTAFAQFKLPVLVEWPDNHVGVRGGNVLFMDGHTEWIDYPGKFPMTEEAMGVLTQLAGRGPIRAVEPGSEGPTRLERLLSLVGISSRR